MTGTRTLARAPSAADDPEDLKAVVDGFLTAVGQVVRQIRTIAPLDMNLSQSAALSRLVDHGAMTTAELARAEAMKPQSMGSILAFLEKGGLVQRQRDPRDGRQILFEATEEGRAQRIGMLEARRDWLLQRAGGLDAGDRRTLAAAAALLQKLGNT